MFVAQTGKIIVVNEREELPKAPREFTWRPLCQRSSAELRSMAREYRRMAATATTLEARDALLRLNRRLASLAAEKNPPQ